MKLPPHCMILLDKTLTHESQLHNKILHRSWCIGLLPKLNRCLQDTHGGLQTSLDNNGLVYMASKLMLPSHYMSQKNKAGEIQIPLDKKSLTYMHCKL